MYCCHTNKGSLVCYILQNLFQPTMESVIHFIISYIRLGRGVTKSTNITWLSKRVIEIASENFLHQSNQNCSEDGEGRDTAVKLPYLNTPKAAWQCFRFFQKRKKIVLHEKIMNFNKAIFNEFSGGSDLDSKFKIR